MVDWKYWRYFNPIIIPPVDHSIQTGAVLGAQAAQGFLSKNYRSA